jgi:hypothetical protein
MSKIRDYIILDTDDFEKKYGEETYDDTRELARKQAYSASYVVPEFREKRAQLIEDGSTEQDADKKISRILKRKAFSSEFINRYIAALRGPKIEGFKDLIESFDITYYGKPLTTSDLEEELNVSKLSIPDGMEDVIKQTIKTLTIDEQYQEAVEQLLDRLEVPKQKAKMTYSPGDIIDIINPVLTKDREEFYDFWEDIHPLYPKLKNAIENVLRDWQGVSKELHAKDVEDEELRGQYKETLDLPEIFRESEQFIELEKEMIQLAKLYQKMSTDLNYVKEVESLSFKLIDSDDGSIHHNVIEMLKDEILDLAFFSGKGDTIGSEERPDNESEDSLDDSQPQFGDDGEMTGTPQPSAIYDPTDPEAKEAHDREEVKRAANLYTKIHQVDPLSALAQFKNKFKRGAFTSRSYRKFIDTMEEEIKELGKADPDMINQLWELMDDLNDAQKEIIDVSKDNYYIPLTTEMVKILNMSREEKIDDLSEIEDFHNDLIKLIQDIIETEDSSMAPWITEYSDTVSGASEPGYGDKSKGEDSIQFTRFNIGKTGLPRDLGEFAESIGELLQLINDYYVIPAESHYLPFEDIPNFLDSKYLSKSKITGPESLYQLMEFGYYSLGAQMIDQHELRIVNDFLEMMKHQTEVDMTEAVNITERMLEVLTEIFDERFEVNDKKLLSKILLGVFEKNDFDASGIKLGGEQITELGQNYKRKDTSSYFLLIKLMRHYKELFLKDKKKKKEMDRFYELLEGIRNPLELSQQRNILIAHDEIRKMLKKPIHYSYRKLDDFDDITHTIDLVKSKYKQDITATDITYIVTEVDSINSLSKKHGLGEELIYHIKGLYR